MESDPLLSDLSAEARLELCMLLLDERRARREPAVDVGQWQGSSQRRMLLNILRKLGPTAEIIRELADELHVELEPLLERARDDGERHINRRDLPDGGHPAV